MNEQLDETALASWHPDRVAPTLASLTSAEARSVIREWTEKVLRTYTHARAQEATGEPLSETARIAMRSIESAWMDLFASWHGPRRLSALKEEVGYRAEALRGDEQIRVAVEALVERLGDQDAATSTWAEHQKFSPTLKVTSVFRSVPAIQREHWEKLQQSVGDDVEIPSALKGLYAAMDGLHVELASTPAEEWSRRFEPVIAPLAKASYAFRPEGGVVVFGAWGEASLGCCVLDASIVLLPWNLDLVVKVADGLHGFLLRLAANYGYVAYGLEMVAQRE